MSSKLRFLAALTTVLCFLPAGARAADVGFAGWGPRFGIADDPDQILAGVHFDLGEIASHVRMQPSVELGFGDDVNSLSGNLLIGYWFPTQGSITPYAGGQLAVVYFDVDGGDSDTEIGFDAVGGFETRVGGSRMLVELQLGFGDIHDIKALVGWKF